MATFQHPATGFSSGKRRVIIHIDTPVLLWHHGAGVMASAVYHLYTNSMFCLRRHEMKEQKYTLRP